ncbi:MAG: uridine kinase [Lachnospiraceae bacterium]
MEDALSKIIREVQTCEKKPMLVAIDGRCASGKTTLAARLKEELHCNVIHMDHFFLQPEQRTEKRLREPGGNVDYERFLEEVIYPFKKGTPFSYREFDCKSMGFVSDIPVEPDTLTIVEGAYCCHPALWDSYNLRIFLSVDPEEQLRRIARRNGEQALVTFRERWIPLEEQYFSTFHIQERCDYSFI